MKQSHRLALQALGAVFNDAGLPWRVINGGKHMCVVVTAPDGTEHKMPMSGSPRCAESALSNQRQQAQRLLERIGIEQNRGAQGQANHHRPKGPPPRRALVLEFDRPDLDAGPYRDPWAVLAGLAKTQDEGIIEPGQFNET